MTKREFKVFIEKNNKEVEQLMQDIEEASKRFDKKVKEILQH